MLTRDYILGEPQIRLTVGDYCEVYKMCSITKKEYKVEVEYPKLHEYMNGIGYVQTQFPDLDEDQREFIQSGITPAEWDDLNYTITQEKPTDD